MKKRNYIVIFLFIPLAILFLFFETQTKVANASMSESVMNGSVKIPDESIRLRILANSDTVADQQLKRKIRDEVNAQITTWVGELTDIKEARKIIRKQLPAIEQIVQNELKKSGVNKKFSVELGQVAFPTKIYGEYIYPAGKYEAVLIKLGEGEGKNWWCVLFPPLCFLDFENGDAVKEDKDGKADHTATASIDQTQDQPDQGTDQIETKFFVLELFSSLVKAVGSLFS
ncbi:stage II sporulation protein R [Fictibacillus barbaricus]